MKPLYLIHGSFLSNIILAGKYFFMLVGWLVMFYNISNLESNLMPDPIYTYILNIYDL